MNAEIVLVNPKRSMVAARSEDVGFVVFELLGSYSPEVGNIVSHSDFSSLGSEEYRNLTQRELMDVYVQNTVGTMEAAKKQCFLR